MRKTFGQLVDMAQDYVVDPQTSSVNNLTNTKLFLKREINNVVSEINSMLSNHTVQPLSRTMTTTADQIYYSFPPNLNRVVTATQTVGGITYPLEVVNSQKTWEDLQMVEYAASTIPRYIFPRQYDFGIYPTPQDEYTVTLNGIYEPVDMTADDEATGTVAVSQNTTTITGTLTAFSSDMVGRWFCLANDSGEPNGSWYRINTYSSTTSLGLTTFFEESTVTGRSYVIGESPEIPVEIHPNIPLLAASRYMLVRRRDSSKAREFANYAMTGNPADDRRNASVTGGILGIINSYKLSGRANTQLLTRKKTQYSRFREVWTTQLSDSE